MGLTSARTIQAPFEPALDLYFTQIRGYEYEYSIFNIYALVLLQEKKSVGNLLVPLRV